jgi:hypothetical protein
MMTTADEEEAKFLAACKAAMENDEQLEEQPRRCPNCGWSYGKD